MITRWGASSDQSLWVSLSDEKQPCPGLGYETDITSLDSIATFDVPTMVMHGISGAQTMTPLNKPDAAKP